MRDHVVGPIWTPYWESTFGLLLWASFTPYRVDMLTGNMPRVDTLCHIIEIIHIMTVKIHNTIQKSKLYKTQVCIDVNAMR